MLKEKYWDHKSIWITKWRRRGPDGTCEFPFLKEDHAACWIMERNHGNGCIRVSGTETGCVFADRVNPVTHHQFIKKLKKDQNNTFSAFWACWRKQESAIMTRGVLSKLQRNV